MPDERGVLGGSRLLDQPAHRGEVEDWHHFLAAPGPVLLEVGFDHGRRLLASARAHPDWRFGGMEVRRRRVHGVRVQAEEAGLDNLLAWRVDARAALARTPPGRLAFVEVLFPTPWWDEAKRAKRLLVTPPFIASALRALAPDGHLLVATDVARYAAEIESALAHLPRTDGWTVRPACEVPSRRERKCAREGLQVWRFSVGPPPRDSGPR